MRSPSVVVQSPLMIVRFSGALRSGHCSACNTSSVLHAVYYMILEVWSL